MDNENKPLLGISSCLLGSPVRHNSGHKRDLYLRDELGRYVAYLPVCPEVECGLPVPRESMHLEGDVEAPRLIATKSGTDHTKRMEAWCRKKLDELKERELCGFIFKSKSPSSGLYRIKIFNGKSVYYNGRGLFARAFTEQFPLLPVEEEGRLQDPGLRENFIQRVFMVHRWNQINRPPYRIRDLVDFHTRHKLILMAHHNQRLYDLGKIVAAPDKQNPQETFRRYYLLLMDVVAVPPTRGRNCNVMQHIAGYFRDRLDDYDREALHTKIEQYRDGIVPLVVPLTLINHFAEKHRIPYVKDQLFLSPHPAELKLRNLV